MATSPRLIAIDLFAGAGGFSLAAKKAGMDVRLAVEIDPHACQTYRRNLVPKGANTPKLVEDDIRHVEWKAHSRMLAFRQASVRYYLAVRPARAARRTVLTTRALLLAYFDCLAHIKPEAFLIENVPGLLWPRHAKYLESFLAKASGIVYRVRLS